jgi:hypothetical protein
MRFLNKIMCGVIYEEDFPEATLRKDSKVFKKKEHRRVESGDRGMNDLKFTTAADFMADQYYYPGSDPQE